MTSPSGQESFCIHGNSGTGVSTMHEVRNAAYVIDNSHYVTQPYPLGEFTFEAGMWMDATEVAGTGVALISADDEVCDPCDMNCDGAIDAFDIEPFLDLLFQGPPPCAECTGDVNGDGVIDAFDIEPFLECLFP